MLNIGVGEQSVWCRKKVSSKRVASRASPQTVSSILPQHSSNGREMLKTLKYVRLYFVRSSI